MVEVIGKLGWRHVCPDARFVCSQVLHEHSIFRRGSASLLSFSCPPIYSFSFLPVGLYLWLVIELSPQISSPVVGLADELLRR